MVMEEASQPEKVMKQSGMIPQVWLFPQQQSGLKQPFLPLWLLVTTLEQLSRLWPSSALASHAARGTQESITLKGNLHFIFA